MTYNDKFKEAPIPYWIASTSATEFPKLMEDLSVDTAIIGGGIVGITSAFLLKRCGLKVAVLEGDHIIQGTSAHTTAKITSQHNLIYNKITNQMGKEKARQYASANQSAIEIIATLINELKIDCDFERKPAFVYTQSEKYIDKISDEVKAASLLGIQAFYEEHLSLPFMIKAAIRFENQAQFHPRKYLLALAGYIPGNGSSIFENTRVIDIKEESPCIIITSDNKKVKAKNVIIASHFPCYDGKGLYFTRMYAEKSYIVAVKYNHSLPEGMYISAESPTRSLRTQRYKDGEMLLVGGENHKTGHESETDVHYVNLLNFAKEIFQMEDLLYRWSTQDCMTIDGVPYIGTLTSKTPNIYVATGFGKWGMTNGTAAAVILKDMITKGDNPWKEVFLPSRYTPAASVPKFIAQNADVAEKYVGGKLAPIPDDINLKPGEAKITEVDGNKVGAYMDEKNQLHMVDCTCTHLGCELVWNSAEKSWDCPCHGSRFTYEGEIIEGPAVNKLKHNGDGRNKINPNIF